MNPLELLTQLFVKGYGVAPDVARRQAIQLINKPDDPLTAQALDEARRMDSFNRYNPEKPAVTRTFQPQDFQGVHVVAKPAPIPSVPAAATPEHLADADLSAWQRYSDIVKAIPRRADLSSGVPAGKR